MIVFNALCVYIVVVQVLAAESAYQVELLEFRAVPVDELGPFVHFIACLFVEFVLEVVVFLLELLREFVYDIVLELEELPLLLVVVHEHASLSQLPRQVVGQDVYVNFEVLGDSVLNIVVDLSVFMQKLQLIRSKRQRILLLHRSRWLSTRVSTGRKADVLQLLLLLRVARGNLLHGHEDFVNPSDVLLNFSNVILQHRQFDSLGRLESGHDSSVFITNVLLYDTLYSFDLIKAVVKPHDLSDKLRSLWDQALVDVSIYCIKSILECVFDG